MKTSYAFKCLGSIGLVLMVFSLSALAFQEKEIPPPDYLSGEAKVMFARLFSNQAREGSEQGYRKRMDEKEALTELTKQRMWSLGTDSWLNASGRKKETKLDRMAFYVEKSLYEESKKFWDEEHKSLAKKIKEGMSIEETANFLIELVSAYSESSNDNEMSLSFYADVTQDFTFPDKIGIRLWFNRWKNIYSPAQRAFFYQQGNAQGISSVLLGRDYFMDAATRLAQESQLKPRQPNRPHPAMSLLGIKAPPVEDDGLSIEEREAALGFRVKKLQEENTLQIEGVSFVGFDEPIGMNDMLLLLLPEGKVVEYEKLHRMFGMYIEKLRSNRNVKANVTYEFTISPYKHGAWEYSQVKLKRIAEE